ncbi:MAG TPA: hypothetical protein VKA63_02590 [Candidatus Krumholzibacteria bacterium]|nr:hypothetical protein [Candidatus Krumholzibacteria bacterium]
MEKLENHVVSAWEWRILSRLREVPEGPLRDRLLDFLNELVVFVQEPRCAQVQADGVPCGAVDADCEECLKVNELLDTLHGSLQRP